MSRCSGAANPERISDPGRRIGATLLPRVHVQGKRPAESFLRDYPPAGLIGFGRSPRDGETLAGLPELLAEVRGQCAELGHSAPFVCCDLEEGAGLHLAGATRLVPALALAAADMGRSRSASGGSSGEPDWILSAACLTGWEARALGVSLVLAPVVDVNTARDNPIIAVRSFGVDPGEVARRAQRFVRGLELGGVGACIKHFPGHGDTSEDSHSVLPRLSLGAEELRQRELIPYRMLLPDSDEQRAPDCVMVAHLDVPALTGEQGLPTTLSERAVEQLLVRELGYGGAVLSDGIDMGALRGMREIHTRAIAAGCHGLLCPEAPEVAATEIFRAAESPSGPGRASWGQVERAAQRMERLRVELSALRPAQGALLAEVHPGACPDADMPARLEFTEDLAEAALCASPERGDWQPTERWELASPSAATGEVRAALERTLAGGGGGEDPLVVALAARVSAGHGSAGATGEQLERAQRLLRAAQEAGRPAALLWFGTPQLLPQGLWDGPWASLVAFGPAPPLIAAAGRWLRGGAEACGALPAELGEGAEA